MYPIIIHRVGTLAVLPMVAAGGWAGYDAYYHTPNPPACIQIASSYSANDMRDLQDFLSWRGYLQGYASGSFDEATHRALARFQADEGIPPSGWLDRETRDRLEELTCGGSYDHGYPQSSLSITGLDAPRALDTGEQGTWSVHVSGVGGRDQLRYSVVWGDENTRTGIGSDYSGTTINSSGSFTHTYHTPGTYTPTFTVTDGAGRRVSARATVRVTGSYYSNDSYGYYYDRNYDYTNSGCSGYYDRTCYVNGQYQGPSYGNGSTYNGPGGGYYDRGYDYSYTSDYPVAYNTTDYSCYYDRACLARMEGRTY